MKPLPFLLVFLVFFGIVTGLVSLHAQSSLEKTGKNKQESLLSQDSQKRKAILALYDAQIKKWKKRFPELQWDTFPIDPNLASDIREHNQSPESTERPMPPIFTTVKSRSQLFVSPYSSETIPSKARIESGELVEVVFVLKKDLNQKVDSPNWALVRSKKKEEGYVRTDSLSAQEEPKERTIGSGRSDLEKPFFDPNTGEIVNSESDEWTDLPGRVSLSSPSISFITDAMAGQTLYVQGNLVNLRSNPDTNSYVLLQLPRGTQVKVLKNTTYKEVIDGKEGFWIEVETKEQTGWVFGSLLGSLPPTHSVASLAPTKPGFFQLPVDHGRVVSSSFGLRIDPVTGKPGSFHNGIDIPSPIGTPIRAVSEGSVWRTLTTPGGYGVLTILEHKDNLYTYYAHQNRRNVKQGEIVSAGQVIGEVGNTGKSTGPHLHFEVRKGPSLQVLDPKAFLPR